MQVFVGWAMRQLVSVAREEGSREAEDADSDQEEELEPPNGLSDLTELVKGCLLELLRD
jgi:hypothetical protein